MALTVQSALAAAKVAQSITNLQSVIASLQALQGVPPGLATINSTLTVQTPSGSAVSIPLALNALDFVSIPNVIIPILNRYLATLNNQLADFG